LTTNDRSRICLREVHGDAIYMKEGPFAGPSVGQSAKGANKAGAVPLMVRKG